MGATCSTSSGGNTRSGTRRTRGGDKTVSESQIPTAGSSSRYEVASDDSGSSSSTTTTSKGKNGGNNYNANISSTPSPLQQKAGGTTRRGSTAVSFSNDEPSPPSQPLTKQGNSSVFTHPTMTSDTLPFSSPSSSGNRTLLDSEQSSSVAVAVKCPIQQLIEKMEKEEGLTGNELDQATRISRLIPAYIHAAQRAKLITQDSASIASRDLSSPSVVFPAAGGGHSNNRKSLTSFSPHSSVHTSGAGTTSDSHVQLFGHGSHVESASLLEVSLMGTTHKDDPKLIQMIEESRKKCYQSWLVIRCWKSVLDREDTGLETSFVELLHRSGSHVLGAERSDLFVNFINRGKPILDMITKLIELGLDNAESVYTLHELGARHVAYGVTRQDYESYTGPFVRTVEMCARPSTMNTQVRTILRGFFQRATSMMLEGAVESRSSLSLKFAPKGSPFAIVFTDIEGSTSLWESQPVAMEKAVDDHHKLMRELIHDHNGYEVKTIGDSFMVAFKSLADAVTMALRVQVELFRASSEGLVVDGTNCEASGPDNVWNPFSLRVRVGVHWCTDALPKFDVVYKRYDYYGNDVNASARIQDAACGGQMLCTSATLKALNRLEAELNLPNDACGQMKAVDSQQLVGDNRTKASLKDVLGTSLYMENAELKGLQDSVTLHSLYPKVLEGRVFGKRKKDVFTE